ncbi:SDR family NAD(P)-dependent oxidoreductase [Novosphingobium bradum]|uniref:SDR family NAD(P)-dependent oxidoreductase n=1 Tax=Novosphingobium bradum TaxID=1737444 RepID=A0ABV7IN44_9SPHN
MTQSSPLPLAGKVAIVTGASYGIGRCYAIALASQGATVVAAARNLGESATPGTLMETAAAGEGLPGRIVPRRCDVTSEAEVKALVAQTVAEFGRIDVLINNAAVYTHHDSFAIDLPTWDHHMAVNLRGPYLTMREVAPIMKRQGSGSIVNLTSAVAGNTDKGHRGHDDMLLYCVTKAGLNRLSHFMSEELKGFGVAVNALSPGPVDTETWNTVDAVAVAEFKEQGWVTPCTPEAVGPPIVALAQHSAATKTGQVLHAGEYGKSWN